MNENGQTLDRCSCAVIKNNAEAVMSFLSFYLQSTTGGLWRWKSQTRCASRWPVRLCCLQFTSESNRYSSGRSYSLRLWMSERPLPIRQKTGDLLLRHQHWTWSLPYAYTDTFVTQHTLTCFVVCCRLFLQMFNFWCRVTPVRYSSEVYSAFRLQSFEIEAVVFALNALHPKTHQLYSANRKLWGQNLSSPCN